MVALVAGGGAKTEADASLAREPRDTLTWSGAPVVAAAPLRGRLGKQPVWAGGALVRSAQMAGGLEFLLAQSVKYVTERKQFGRPLAAFQAIQQNLALLAGHTAAAGMAAQQAFHVVERTGEGGDASFEIAVAKVRTGEAAGLGAGIAHQAHGAIGFTYEHSLHFVTRRLWSWRAEFGAESHWSVALGREVAAARRGRALAAHDVTLGESHMHTLTLGDVLDLAHRRDRPLVLPHRPDAARVRRGADRAHHRWIKPHFFDDVTGDLGSRIQTWIVRTPRHTVLVDTGVGNDKSRARERDLWNKRQGGYLDDLRRGRRHAGAGGPGAVHASARGPRGLEHAARGRPLGAHVPEGAKYVFPGEEWEFWKHEEQAGREKSGCIADSVVPVVEAGQAVMVDSAYQIDPWLAYEPWVGHTPGHVGVRVHTSAGDAVFSGDLMHRVVQVAEPQWSSIFCYDGQPGRGHPQGLRRAPRRLGRPGAARPLPASRAHRARRRRPPLRAGHAGRDRGGAARERRAGAAARGHSRRRGRAEPRRADGGRDPRPHGRRRHQGGAARGRRRAQVGAALLEGRLAGLPRGQRQQARDQRST